MLMLLELTVIDFTGRSGPHPLPLVLSSPAGGFHAAYQSSMPMAIWLGRMIAAKAENEWLGGWPADRAVGY
jgi:hypothetical protein